MPAVPAPPLPETCCATLWLRPGEALYAGPSLGLARHSGSVSCLAVGVDGAFTVETDGRERTVRSALVAARTPHRLVSAGRMVFCYFDPASAREHGCRAAMTAAEGPVHHGHEHEPELVHAAGALFAPGTDPEHWTELVSPLRTVTVDERVLLATRRLLAHPDRTLPAAGLAAEAGLSPSRFLHLFREHTGTSFRRYRLWARMLRAGTLLAARRGLTEAAADAGFASPSHLSDSFHAMFGLRPSRLLATGVAIRVPEGPGHSWSSAR
ncbi:helix-turn-helix domain-containing protein [Amycolatopsis samaneae]|uniref:Helix-turn-helix domain-containing protein n=1 Tax=Amycolatopsis samaneae TaxID=664691 RepID=A0ABW5GHM9_9PSEU